MTKDEALRMALEALEDLNGMAQFFPDELYSDHPDVMKAAQAITAIKEALAQQSNISELKEKTANHNVDCLCADCSMLDDLEDATAQPEQEPVAWMVTSEMQDGTKNTYPLTGRFKDVKDVCDFGNPIPLYTTPPQRKPLTDEQRNWIVATCPTPRHIIDTVEKMHGIKE